ncbi:MAG: serine/threonine-protein kinase [Lacipirellulaceae bacterium]
MHSCNTAEELAQSALDVGVLTEAQLRAAWGEAGSTTVSADDFAQALLRKGLVTTYQLERLQRGDRDGYAYGDYVALYCVGAGTFARVFRAANKQTGKIYAVKVLRARKAADPKMVDFFRREGELGKSLQHQNIVAVHEVVSRPGLHYLVMDFIEGRNLRDWYRVRGKFEWQEATSILAGVLAGLHFAFQQGITHRDLKMSNVLVASDGVAKVVDFGLAALDSVATDEVAGVTRTVEYAALEKATGVRRDDPRSDVFFAGCILHQLLTGFASLPEGRDRAQKFGRDTFKNIRPVLDLAPKTPLAIAMVIGKSLELDPERRYQSPGDMLTDLKLAIRRAEGAASASEGKAALQSQEGQGPDGQPRKLMIVESDTKRQDVLRELFKQQGYRVLVASDADRALERFIGDPNAAEGVLFCAATIGADAVHAFNKFGGDIGTRDKAAVLLLEQPQAPWAASAKPGARRAVVTMPVKQRDLRDAVLGAFTGQAVPTR